MSLAYTLVHTLPRPLGLLYPSDDCVGYAMPLVDLKGAVTLDALLSEKTQRAYGLPADYKFAVQAACSLAAAVAALHAHGYYVIDLKPANISVYKTTPLLVLLDSGDWWESGRLQF